MANDIWREQQSVLTWIEIAKDGYEYIRHQCPHCTRTHRCLPANEHNTDKRVSEPVYVPFESGERVKFIINATGNTQKGPIPIKLGQLAQVIEDREMAPGRHRLFVTLDPDGVDCWVPSMVVERYTGRY